MGISDNTIICLTGQQLKEFAIEAARAALQMAQELPDPEVPSTKRYVYGLRGIRDLFNVSHVTAQRYKDTFLADAIVQRGRKIMIDADKAIELYNQHQS